MTVVLSGGERHESQYLTALLEQGAVKRSGPGRPRLRPACVIGDKGYSYPGIRRYLRGRAIRAVIPRRRDQGRDRGFNHAAYRERNRVERLINRLKQWRRVATRYEKRAANYQAIVTLAAICLWL